MVPLLALSLQDQVEKYGAYIGIAAFFGLAALSLLYFAQARELKRLRDWAGRAPERAREVEERVSVQAEEARRAAAAPAVPVPAPAPAPQPIGAATAAGARSGTVGPAVPVPAAPGAAEHGDLEEDELPDAAPEPAASAPGRDGRPAAVAATPEAPEEEDEEAGEESDEDEQEGAGEGEEDLEPAAAEPTPAPSSPSNGAPAGPPRPAFPRPSTAAGAAAVGAAVPPPAAMPLRAGAPSATLPLRRPVTLPPRRSPPPLPEPERHSRTFVAALGGVIAVVLAGGAFVATQLLGGDEPKAPNRPVSPTTSTPSRGDSDSSDSSRPTTRATTTVAVFNGTTITGLASGIADKVQAGGFKRGSTGNDTNQQRATSLVLYTREARAEGREAGKLLRISDVRPIDAETQALAGGNADVVVIVGLDQAP